MSSVRSSVVRWQEPVVRHFVMGGLRAGWTRLGLVFKAVFSLGFCFPVVIFVVVVVVVAVVVCSFVPLGQNMF